MEKKKFSIELPKGGMSNLAKQTSLQTTPRAISECYRMAEIHPLS